MTGKTVAQRTYLHISCLETAGAELAAWVAEAECRAGVHRAEDFNVVRCDLAGGQIALLNYPAFFDEAFPTLATSWLVDLDAGTVGYRTYADSQNPPILHRKELLLPADHPRREDFVALTLACESIGLFDQPARIGYRRQWLELVRERGYRIDGLALLPLGNDEGEDDRTVAGMADGALPVSEPPAPDGQGGGWQAARQLTALVRYGLSAPIQALARHGFLDGRLALFDYGCGRGDDVRALTANGLQAAGWDPFYAPEQPLRPAPLVNLGFVINVIEDREERLEALTSAWLLTETLLVVAVMLANQNAPRGTGFADGVLTRRGTFQRYYTQTEIRAYLTQALDEEPIPVAPGVLFVFRDKDAEQRFLLERYRSRRRPPALIPARPRPPRPERDAERLPQPARDRSAERYAAHRELLDRLWGRWLELGRQPEPDEVGADLPELMEAFGTLAKALRFLAGQQDPDILARAEAARRADVLVYLALNQFERRRPYKHLDPGLQRDIKVLFGDSGAAQQAALGLLFMIRDTEAIADACQEAAARGLGWLEPGESLQLPASLVEQLAPLLRVYVGCATVLYGDYRDADLVKIHIGSGKLSLLRYDAFVESPLPRLIERVKIRLREQDIDSFLYGDGTGYPAPYLYHKSRYINEEFPHYPEQAAFEETLDALALCDLSGYGPSAAKFDEILARRRWVIDGFDLRRPDTAPDLDAPCGRFLTFRQLIECGETQSRTGLPNLPRRMDSFDALQDLAEQVLDPVIDWFGMIRLTYGFCSPELAREITGRIDPRLDQHAAHEHNRLGKPICSRQGAAVDFLVEDEDMAEVARWLAQNTPFDRLYFYGANQPIHVSFGPEHSRQVVRMVPTANGRLVPRVVKAGELTGAG